jgi:hypothetical protein
MSDLAHMAEHFYGYGRWDAPFWFIGPEPGMAKTGDSLERRFESWKMLDSGPVIDCAAHHRGFGYTKWHQSHPPTQATWRQLIRLLLSYKGQPTDLEAVRTYQRDQWGSFTGETCVIELSGLASSSLRTPQDRKTFLSMRLAYIRTQALRNRPVFIVMYGVGHVKEWERITGAKFDANGICRIGTTVAATSPHPVTRGLGNEYWVTRGQSLRAVIMGSTEV